MRRGVQRLTANILDFFNVFVDNLAKFISSAKKVLLCNTGPQKREKQKLDDCCRKSSTLSPTCHHTNKLSPYGYHSGHVLLKSILHITITDLSHVARLRHLAFGQMVKSAPVVLV